MLQPQWFAVQDISCCFTISTAQDSVLIIDMKTLSHLGSACRCLSILRRIDRSVRISWEVLQVRERVGFSSSGVMAADPLIISRDGASNCQLAVPLVGAVCALMGHCLTSSTATMGSCSSAGGVPLLWTTRMTASLNLRGWISCSCGVMSQSYSS